MRDPLSLLGVQTEIDPDLVAVAAGDREPSPAEARELERQRRLRGPRYYSDLLLKVTNEHYSYAEARQLWEEIVAHKAALTSKLGRNPGIAVAGLDYLANVRRQLPAAEIISEPKLRAIAALAILDPVTGLMGRAAFESRLRNELHRHARYGNRVALLMLDIDDFKRVNDTMGHRHGDAVLARIGQILRIESRDVDIPCRYGGEELAVILPQTDLEDAMQIGERVRARVERELGSEGAVTVSGGVACCPEHGTSPDALIDAADKALYVAKRAGKNRVVAAQVKTIALEQSATLQPTDAPDGIAEARRIFGAQTDAAYSAETADLVRLAGEIAARQPESIVIQGLRDAGQLVTYKFDHLAVCAALVTPARRHGLTTEAELQRVFGADTAALVESLLPGGRPGTGAEGSREGTRAELRRLCQDERTASLQVALRLAELRRLTNLDGGGREIATEALQLHVPLAARLGMRQLRQHLEDECFRLLEPEAYRRLREAIAPAREQDEACVNLLKEGLQQMLARSGVVAGVEARVKGLYSIHSKMVARALPLEAIMDRLGLRVIVPRVTDCYSVLGLVHSHFRPVPGTFDDYIGLPKSNGYQSLHTCVYPVREISAKQVEFQIRTELMHREAEYGVAAHWLYKEDTAKAPEAAASTLAWLRGLPDRYDHCVSRVDFLERLRKEVFEERIVVFGNAGQRIKLPVPSTVRDLVARFDADPDPELRLAVNGQLQSLDHALCDGDSVDLGPCVTNTSPAGGVETQHPLPQS